MKIGKRTRTTTHKPQQLKRKTPIWRSHVTQNKQTQEESFILQFVCLFVLIILYHSHQKLHLKLTLIRWETSMWSAIALGFNVKLVCFHFNWARSIEKVRQDVMMYGTLGRVTYCWSLPIFFSYRRHFGNSAAIKTARRKYSNLSEWNGHNCVKPKLIMTWINSKRFLSLSNYLYISHNRAILDGKNISYDLNVLSSLEWNFTRFYYKIHEYILWWNNLRFSAFCHITTMNEIFITRNKMNYCTF